MIDNKENKIALIYCRVSSERQKNEGHGLDGQEHRCSEYAKQKGYSISKEVFKDSFTGGGDFRKRPELSRMFTYINDNPHKSFVVIIDDLSRAARDVKYHFELKNLLLQKYGVLLECTNFNFDDSPEGELIETMMAAQNQYHRKNNRRQVIQKMKARMERGYWTFYPPPGYSFIKDSFHGKLLKPNKLARIVKEAFEGFETGILSSQVDVQNFLQQKNFSGKGKRVYLEKVKRLLTRSVYAGIIEYQKWEVEPRDGHHKALISKVTFHNVQEILNSGHRIRTRKDINKDFPLRGLVKTLGAKTTYTGAYATGRNKKYPYYRDVDKGSKYFNKSFKKEIIEDSLKKLFGNLSVSEEVLDFSNALIIEEWEKRNNGKKDVEKEILLEVREIEKQKEKFLERIEKATNDSIIETYESKIETLLIKEKTLNINLGKYKQSGDFGTALSCVLDYVKNPLKQWEEGDLVQKRIVVQMVFDGPAEYDGFLGFGTENLAPIYSVFETISDSKSQQVEMAGIEPASK